MNLPAKLKGVSGQMQEGKDMEFPEMDAADVFSGRKEAAESFRVVEAAYEVMLTAAQTLYEQVIGEEGVVDIRAQKKKQE